MLKEYLYKLKYHLSRSYIIALAIILLFIYNGKIALTDYVDILLYSFISWFAIQRLGVSLAIEYWIREGRDLKKL